MIRAIIFDLDGTLLNTLTDLTQSVNYALEQHGLPLRTADEVRQRLGNGVQRLVLDSVPRDCTPEEAEQVVNTFRPYYKAHCLDFTQPYEGISETVATLTEQDDFLLAVVSNKPQAEVGTLVSRFFSSHIKIAVGESPTIRRKPAPDMLLSAMARMGMEKDECLFVGDSEVDILTASNASVKCLSVAWGFRSKNELLSHGAKIIADAPTEIPQIVRNLNQKLL